MIGKKSKPIFSGSGQMNHRAASRAVSKIATPKNNTASSGAFTSRESGINSGITVNQFITCGVILKQGRDYNNRSLE
jgi:hypothetical protein